MLGILNKIINILILLMAIGAVVLSFFLAEKRKDLLMRGNDLASTVESVANELDKGSETGLTRQLMARDMKQHKNIPAVKKNAVDQAKQIIEQRDALAKTMEEVAGILNIPDVRETDFQAVASYQEKDGALVDAVSVIKERSNGIISNIVEIGDKIGVSIDPLTLKNQNYKEALAKLDTQVEDLHKRNGNYVNHIAEVTSLLGVEEPDLRGADYTSSLETAMQGINLYKRTFEQTRSDLDATKKQVEKAQKSLAKLENELTEESKEKESLRKELADAKDQIEKINKLRSMGPNAEGKTEDFRVLTSKDPEALKLLKGKVIDVNRKWDFVVINLGKENTVYQKIDDKTVNPVPVKLPLDREMTVARGIGVENEFVGKIKIVKVYDVCAIGNILPEPKGGSIEKGDIVYFQDEEKK